MQFGWLYVVSDAQFGSVFHLRSHQKSPEVTVFHKDGYKWLLSPF